MKITVETSIQRPRAEVYEAFTDIPGSPARISDLEHVELLGEGPFAPGYAWRETRTLFGKSRTELVEVTQTDAPSSYQVVSDSMGTRYTTDVTFTEASPGATTVRMTVAARPMSVSARLMTPLGYAFRGATGKLLSQELEDMRAALESGQRSTVPSHLAISRP